MSANNAEQTLFNRSTPTYTYGRYDESIVRFIWIRETLMLFGIKYATDIAVFLFADVLRFINS